MYYQIQIRRGTAAEWTATNPILAAGELAVESDTNKMKVGNGSTAWTSLAYAPIGTPIDGSITETKIANNAITQAKIANNAVTQAKLASTLSGITICTSSTRPSSPFAGQMIYETDTGSLLIWKGSSWSGVSKMKNVTTFKASGTFTPPTGATYAIAYIRGGGGGAHGTGGGAGTGGTSSVAFASGTVTAVGGVGMVHSGLGTSEGTAGADNSGNGARSQYVWAGAAYTTWGAANAQDGSYVVAGGAVTAGVGIAVTVGAGGTGNQAGGSGLVYIEYEV